MNQSELTKDPSINASDNESVESQDSSDITTPEDDRNIQDVPESQDENKWEDVLGSGGLLKQILVEGKPDSRPQRLQKCIINFTCTLEDGTLVETKNDFELQLGDSEIVQGLDLALGLMNVGEKCNLKIEGRLAFGTRGLDSIVPPDASVVYEVELLSVEPEEDTDVLTISERRIKGNKKREIGNWWYGRGENQIAIRCYRRALDYLDEVEGGISKPLPDGETEVTDAALQQLLEDRINVSNNMAAAQLKLELYDAALQSLQTVLRCQPDNVKALFRKAKVHRAKNDIPAALKSLKRAQKIMPSNTDVIKEISVLQKLQDKQKNTEKELARRMFNGLQKESKTKKKSPAFKLFLWSTVGASIAVGLLGLAAYRFKLS